MRKNLEGTNTTNDGKVSGTGLFESNAPKGHVIDGVFLSIPSGDGSATPAQIDYIEIDADGDVLQHISGSELDEENKADGLQAGDGQELFIPMTFLTGKDLQPSLGTNIKTKSGGGPDAVDTLKLRVKFVGATTPVATARWSCSEETGVMASPALAVRRVQNRDAVVVGENKITTMLKYGKPEYANTAKILMKLASGNITYVTLKRGKEVLLEKFPKASNDLALVNAGKVPGSYYDYIIDFSRDGLGEYLNTEGLSQGDDQLELTVYSDSATTLYMVQVLVGRLKG